MATYVKLRKALQGRSIVDLNSQWSISGLDVKEVPDKKKHPNAARYIRLQQARGVLVEATKAEFDAVQKANEEGQKAHVERLHELTAMGFSAARVGFAIHQEGAVQQAARDRRAALEDAQAKADAAGEETEDKDYDSWKKAELEAEIDRRNAERDEEDQITPDSNKNEDLAAALYLDDEENAEDE